MTNWQEKIRYLLRAALRAEGEGDRRVAETLRRMAAEAMPLETRGGTAILEAPAGFRSD